MPTRNNPTKNYKLKSFNCFIWTFPLFGFLEQTRMLVQGTLVSSYAWTKCLMMFGGKYLAISSIPIDKVTKTSLIDYQHQFLSIIEFIDCIGQVTAVTAAQRIIIKLLQVLNRVEINKILSLILREKTSFIHK